MPLKSGQEGKAMYCNSRYGPTFGGENDSHDPRITPESKDNFACLKNAYQCPSGKNAETFLTRGETFSVSEMEVYRL